MTDRTNYPTETDSGNADHEPGKPDAVPSSPLRIRYRVRFAKRDLLRWISHRDLARLWERLLRRARLVLSMTEGFHPKPRVSFPSALALGVESLDEVVELELAEDLTAAELLARLQADRQPGLTIHRVERLPENFGKARLQQSDYRITRPESYAIKDVQQAIECLLQQPTVSVQRKKKTLTVELRTQIADLRCDDDLLLSLYSSESASLRPGDVLDLLGFSDWGELGSLTTRVQTVLQHEVNASDAATSDVATDPSWDRPSRGERAANETIAQQTATKPISPPAVERSHK